MPRTYTDQQLADGVATARCWADVAEFLGKPRSYNTTSIKETSIRLGLDTSHFLTRGVHRPIAPMVLPFSRPSGEGSICSGLSVVASWFLSRGYPVSVPIEPAPYDLITESDDGLKRVQVKTTRCTDRAGRFRVGLRRKAYDSTATANAMGKYRRTPYTANEIDLFFVITSSGTNYLIPVGAVQQAGEIILDDKYREYVVG